MYKESDEEKLAILEILTYNDVVDRIKQLLRLGQTHSGRMSLR